MAKDYSRLTLKQLAAEYNNLAIEVEKQTGDIIPSVKKFSNRESGIRRTTELAKTLGPKDDNRGRPAGNNGKGLFPIVDGNPRQAGSHGWHAFKIVQDNPGILYEDYLASGGESHHLRWDIQHKFVEAR